MLIKIPTVSDGEQIVASNCTVDACFASKGCNVTQLRSVVYGDAVRSEAGFLAPGFVVEDRTFMGRSCLQRTA